MRVYIVPLRLSMGGRGGAQVCVSCGVVAQDKVSAEAMAKTLWDAGQLERFSVESVRYVDCIFGRATVAREPKP